MDNEPLVKGLIALAETDDGATLRLANLLKISIQHEGRLGGQGCDRVFAVPKGFGHLNEESVYAAFGGDVDAAVRSAVNRAAKALLEAD